MKKECKPEARGMELDDTRHVGGDEIPSICFPGFTTYSFLFVIYLARICHGLYMSMPSPTLLFLAHNVDSTVAELSPMFTGRAIGMMLGAMVAGYLLKFGRPMISLGFAVLLSGVFMFFIPFVKSSAMILTLIALAGLMAGYLDAGMQALLLKLWGEKDSRPHIQAFHFMFTIGAFLAPLLARPFLIMASATNDAKLKCPGYSTNLSSHSSSVNGSTAFVQISAPPAEEGINPVSYAFIISGLFMVLVSLFFFLMAGLKIIPKIKLIRKGKRNTEERPEEPFHKVWLLFLLVVLFYFFLIGGEHPYVAYIFSIVVCTDLQFSESDASVLNSVLWIGFGAGRSAAVVAAKFFKPSTIILVCLVGGLCSMILLSASGTRFYVVPWIATFFYGAFLAPLYPACVSWTSKLTNISGKYMFIFNFGNAIGSMSMTPVGGILFQQQPLSVIYFSTAFALANLIIFLVMMVYGEHFDDVGNMRLEESQQCEMPLAAVDQLNTN